MVYRIKLFLLRWIIPSGIHQLYVRLTAERNGGSWGPLGQPAVQVSYKSASKSNLLQIRTAIRGDILWIPKDKLRTIMAKALTLEQHPYLRYYSEGRNSIERFFRLNHPNDSFEHVFIFGGRRGVGVKPEIVRSEYFESGDPEIRLFPWSNERLTRSQWVNGSASMEMAQLETVRKSIMKNGMWIGKYELNPRFWLLVNDETEESEDYRAIILGGNHRVAFLVHQKWCLLPMVSSERAEVRLSDSRSWPGVIDGSFSREEARAVFLSFFRSPEESLLPGW